MARIYMIRHEGGSRVLSISKVVPKEWLVVEMEVLKETRKSVIVKIYKVR